MPQQSSLRRIRVLVFFLWPLLGYSPLAAETPPAKIGAVLHITGDLAMQSAAFREGIEPHQL